ncbi:unnamed protein product [Orchesella dallaii]|uniref:Glutamate-gated chloride channel n=1 Tax=Orchesella dallaii TaxID=48710 RepID=A0ABP1PY33_9HEXA
MNYSKLSLLVLYITLSYSSGEELIEFHEKVLDILRNENYSPTVLPPLGQNETQRQILINLGLREIETLDDRRMELKAQFSLRQKWSDTRLQYNTSIKDGYVTIHTDSNYRPWMPDTFVHNEKEAIIHSTTRPNSFFRIYPNGSILHSVRLSTTISCLMDLRRFPFDEQHCEIRLASYAYPKSTLELNWDPMFSLEMIGNQPHMTQFKLVGQIVGRCLMSHVATGEYSTIYVILSFQREIGYYFIQYFIPIGMCVALTWISFWLGPAIEARLSLTVTVLLTLTTQNSGVSGTMSQVSYTTAFSTFTGISTTFAVLSIVQSAYVFTIIRRSQFHTLISPPRMVEIVESNHKSVEYEDGSRITPHSALRVDLISKILFPTLYILFIITYTIVYYAFSPSQYGYVAEDNASCKRQALM